MILSEALPLLTSHCSCRGPQGMCYIIGAGPRGLESPSHDDRSKGKSEGALNELAFVSEEKWILCILRANLYKPFA